MKKSNDSLNIFSSLRKGTVTTTRRGYMNGPFGTKPIIYADSTASGIVYLPIVNYMNENVFPFYSNTHSNAICGKYMSELIDAAKSVIRRHYNCDKEDDQIIFTGNGCTGAILHLIHAMDLKRTADGAVEANVVVFVSITEHHSNYLPWKHLDVLMELVPINERGQLDTQFMLHKMSEYHKKGNSIIASFSGASNVSGIIEDWSSISKIVHSFEGVMLWDMAACAPYVKINMHADDVSGDYMDAIFVSPHKFLGGPGCPGLLIANRKLFINKVPYCPGGGTVRFVCKKFQVYNPDIEVKETGGTPNILGCIQLGKVFELKESIQDYIDNKEKIMYYYCYQMLKNMPNIILIRPSNNDAHSLPIFSFIIRNYHCNLVVVLLNDLFGIQSRGGVSCCSVFAQNILHLSEEDQNQIYQSITQGKGVPDNYGWCRISFHYLMTREEINYILESVFLVATNIEYLSPLYEYDAAKNSWSYRSGGIWALQKPSQRLFFERNCTASDLKVILDTTKDFLRQHRKDSQSRRNLFSFQI